MLFIIYKLNIFLFLYEYINGGDNINYEIKDEITIEEKTVLKNSISVVTAAESKVSLDVCFINESFYKGDKRYFKLFVRLNLVYENNKDFFEKNSKNEYWRVSIDDAEIKLYVRSEKGLVPLWTDPKDNIIIRFGSISRGDEKPNYSVYEFTEVLIDYEKLGWTLLNQIAFSLHYFVTTDVPLVGDVKGNIFIDRHPVIEHKSFKESSMLIEHNFISAYINMDYENEKRSHYINLLRREMNITNSKNNINIINTKLDFKNSYIKEDDTENSSLGVLVNRLMDGYVNSFATFSKVKSTSYLKGNDNLDNYYSIKRKEDKVNFEGDSFSIETIDKTKLDIKTNKVILDESGHEGIILNPLYKGPLFYIWFINFNDLEIAVSNNLKNDSYFIDTFKIVKELDADLKFSYMLNYTLDQILQVDLLDIDKGVKFINENEKQIF